MFLVQPWSLAMFRGLPVECGCFGDALIQRLAPSVRGYGWLSGATWFSPVPFLVVYLGCLLIGIGRAARRATVPGTAESRLVSW